MPAVSTDALLALAVIALIIGVLWRSARPRYGLKIVIHDNRVQSHKGLPQSRQTEVLEFLENDCRLQGKVTVLGRRRPQGYLQLAFRGEVDPPVQQQIRNFLSARL